MKEIRGGEVKGDVDNTELKAEASQRQPDEQSLRGMRPKRVHRQYVFIR